MFLTKKLTKTNHQLSILYLYNKFNLYKPITYWNISILIYLFYNIYTITYSNPPSANPEIHQNNLNVDKIMSQDWLFDLVLHNIFCFQTHSPLS